MSEGRNEMDRAEFEELLNTESSSIYSFCRYLTNDRTAAEDLFQDSVLKAYELRDQINKNSNPKSYILSIAVNIFKNRKRKEHKRMQLAPEISYDQTTTDIADTEAWEDEALLRKEELESLGNVLSRLDDKYRLVIILYYYNQLDIAEISKIAGIPKGTVKSRLHKGRSLIRQGLTAKGSVGHEE